MNSGTIYMLRHGITRSNRERIYAGWSDERLTEEGIIRVNTLGRVIKDWSISAIYTSPIRRAVQTAHILNNYIKGQIIIDHDLREMKMGPWEGMSENEVERKFPYEYKIWQEKPSELVLDGRETLWEIQQRSVNAINRITERGKISLVVTHVAIIRCIILYFNHLSLNFYKSISVPNTYVHHLIANDTGIETKT